LWANVEDEEAGCSRLLKKPNPVILSEAKDLLLFFSTRNSRGFATLGMRGLLNPES